MLCRATITSFSRNRNTHDEATTIVNQTLGASWSHDIIANAPTPARLPSKLIAYARSGPAFAARSSSRAIGCATATKSRATTTKSSGSSLVLSTATTLSAVPLEK